jgi:hypothetical protein
MPEKSFTLAPSQTTVPQREHWKSLAPDALRAGEAPAAPASTPPIASRAAVSNRMVRSTTTRPMTFPGSRFRKPPIRL